MALLVVLLLRPNAADAPGPRAGAPTAGATTAAPSAAPPSGSAAPPGMVMLRDDLPASAISLLGHISIGDIVGGQPGHWAFVLDGASVDSVLSEADGAIRIDGGLVAISNTVDERSVVEVLDAKAAMRVPIYEVDAGGIPRVGFPNPVSGPVVVSGSSNAGFAGVVSIAWPGGEATTLVPARPSSRGFLGEVHWSAGGLTVAVPDCDERTCTVDVVHLDDGRHLMVDALVPVGLTDTWLLGYSSIDTFDWELVDIASGARMSVPALDGLEPWSAHGLPDGTLLVSGRNVSGVLELRMLDPLQDRADVVFVAKDDLSYLYPLVRSNDWAVLGPRAPLALVLTGLESLDVVEIATGRRYEDALRVP